ncbi:MAG TPA: thiamine phosphate synthase [Gemmatimonadaceae bacterium]|nr:thiamine phosphate synthase [Gemmatimonadaceae bacterium]
MIDPSIFRLIAITDNIHDGRDGLIARAAAAAHGGATCIQLRLKDVPPRDLVGVAHELVRAVGVPVLVNDRADIAIAAGAQGVHLGPDDPPAPMVRRFAPADFIIGVSVGSDAEVENAEGADYAGIGPFFRTASKSDAGDALGPEEFSRLAKALKIPAIAIGGISAENAAVPIAAGAAGVALIAGIFGSSDPAEAARRVMSAIET